VQKIIPLLSSDKLPPGCFPSGTSLLTSAGDQLIETLTPGAELVTIRVNGPNLRPIIRVTTHRIQPALIRIRAHAFAPDMPARDLVLSGEHAIYADGALFQLADLCNGISIFPEPAQPASLYRIELDAHDVILAEGLPVESSPPAFAHANDNASPKIVARRPAWAPAARQKIGLPVLSDGPEFLALRRMLKHRAADKRQVLLAYRPAALTRQPPAPPLHPHHQPRPRTGSGWKPSSQRQARWPA
jgi:hypothetical protein